MSERVKIELTTAGDYYLEDILRIIEFNGTATEQELAEAFQRHGSIDRIIEALNISKTKGISFLDALEYEKD